MKGSPSQNLIPISEIRDDVLVLKDGSLRMVMMASSVNFALKSQDEQTAIIAQYQYFLNSLDFSLQIFVQSTALNIEPYLESLVEQERSQTIELLRIQTREYSAFIKSFVETARIMAKTFYVVVPYAPTGMTASEGIGMLGGLFSGAKKKTAGLAEERFAEYKNQLWQRADVVSSGLMRCGVKTAPLKTEELIELFYTLYNPGGGKAPELGS
ncbi:MAG: hypothetical protein HZA25_01175 [Candidatus Niyogibacteria bacterium]|nr:hypothetical protein [Candidatus Niyogibacteria bacterium]